MLVRLVVLTITAVLVPGFGEATAAAPLCQGERATIVGSPGQRVEGTDGPDVIVGNGARVINAGGGDDRVCVTGRVPSGKGTRVVADDGDDQVTVASNHPSGTTVRLGLGNDTFIGGAGPDWATGEGAGIDTIRTRGGRDRVNTYESGDVMDDRIHLGPGADEFAVEAGSMADGASLDGGDGPDHMSVRGNGTTFGLDNVAEELRIDGSVALSWSSFQNFDLDPFGDSVTEVTGGPRSETFVVGRLRSAALGGGDDVLGFSPLGGSGDAAVLRGGAGADYLGPTRTLGAVDVDFADDRAVFSEPAATYRVPGFERASVIARRVRLTGSDGADDLAGFGCDISISGGAGADALALVRVYPGSGVELECNGVRTALRGGGADDRLHGSRYDDELYGGSGRDVGRAGNGRDRCVAIERRFNCERR